MDRLKEIKAREAKASPEPWETHEEIVVVKDGYFQIAPWHRKSKIIEKGYWVLEYPFKLADAIFISHSRSDIPYLLQRLADAERALKGYRNHLNSGVGTFAADAYFEKYK